MTYARDLPQVSVVFIFVNEALSVILRSVHSVVNHTPSQLLKEVILVDDNSDNGEWAGLGTGVDGASARVGAEQRPRSHDAPSGNGGKHWQPLPNPLWKQEAVWWAKLWPVAGSPPPAAPSTLGSVYRGLDDVAILLSPVSLDRVVCGEDHVVQLGYLCPAVRHRQLPQETLPPACRGHICPSTHLSMDLAEQIPLRGEATFVLVAPTPASMLKSCLSSVELKFNLDQYVNKRYPGLVKIVRNSRREGLIRARLQGWKAATAPVVGFFDAHVEFNTGW
ncbi:hypothetical protein P7K49_020685 [Saguinus oedipus]|uniref:Glycosyltransferase 2-like domain-containing protein n=1 Tax=Saguinus oedipus TaxID=9490 RepID=A0ABQ9V0Z9_SAGOE|nr:hypothetical protein P7K49_020685 [Saguinus oedipus]